MTLSLDHIVIAVQDLDAATADYAALGFTVIRGGEHADGVTGNVLVVFQDGSYLELIRFNRPEPGRRWSDVYHSAGEGFLDHALLPTDIAADVAAAQGRGLDIESPIPGGRIRPDGERLEWKTARSPSPDVPFLCGDVSPRRLRVQEGDAVRTQPNGVTGVASLVVAVRDVAESARRYAALLGAPEPAIADRDVGGSAARVAEFTLGGSGTRIVLAQPVDGASELGGILAERGQGPFSVAFRGPAPAALDRARSHGARLAVEGAAA